MRRVQRRLALWVGGLQPKAVPGSYDPRLEGQGRDARYINLEPQIVDGSLDKEVLSGGIQHWQWKPTLREFRSDLYDEITKLPLRFQLHPSSKLAMIMSQSAVGYAPPLGPADADDVIPFHIHRDPRGGLPGVLTSYNIREGCPTMLLTVGNIDGDIFRFEDELIKIYPTKKIFVHGLDSIRIYDMNEDGKEILHHWLLSLGF